LECELQLRVVAIKVPKDVKACRQEIRASSFQGGQDDYDEVGKAVAACLEPLNSSEPLNLLKLIL
jgi:hypothetical protein